MAENKFAAKAGKQKNGITVDVDKGKFVKDKSEKPAKEAKVKAEKPAKEAKVKAPKETTSRASVFAGKKVKKLVKEHGAREGTLRAAFMDAILGAKTTDEVLGTTVSAGDKSGVVSSADIAHAIEAKYINLI